MNACEMVNRCLLAQWNGYGSDIQESIQEMWKFPSGLPGIVGNAGNCTYVLWWVEREGRHEDLLLLSVKEDTVSDDIMRSLKTP